MTRAAAAKALYAAVAKYLRHNLDRPGIYASNNGDMERVAAAARAYRDLCFPKQREAAAKRQAAWKKQAPW